MENQAEEDPHHSDLIATFCSIASSTRDEALFFLESHNFDLDSAVSTFLETTAPAAAAAAPQQPLSPSASLSPSSSPSRSRSPSPPPSLRPPPPSRYGLRPRQDKKKASSSRTAGGIRTLSDLNNRAGGDGSGSDSDDGPQEYYTGGEKR
ncbi:hypothetical protein RHMOL_Rhmol06G0230500 [Rhododendron molle]|uniref:Uncharacterized protein n=1 Tax=Rhododendron molle TaxID=49168 RepID=A0ACC0NGK9_RHOML|nr:hypothetical protein RHMOL_Rhmol06G0230500 [Rhododendron molle]